MLIRKILHELNIVAQCRRLHVEFWSCPQFIFLVMGIVVISVILVTYNVGQQYIDAQIITLIILFVTIFLITVSFIIVRAFERIVDLRELEMRQAKEILELKDQFVFIAAHELRTPANAIKWGLGSLRSERPELFKDEKELLDIIKRGNDRLLLLVEDLLEVTRIESGALQLTLGNTSAHDAFVEACKEIQGLTEEHEVTIQNNMPTLPHVHADAVRLKEVFTNLLSNAVKFSRKGTSVDVSAEDTNNKVTFHITDTGAGLSKEDQEHVFEKFWRSKSAHDVEGTGLGLFIVKSLLERMSGTIWFTSELGKGTTFSFSLDRKDNEQNKKQVVEHHDAS